MPNQQHHLLPNRRLPVFLAHGKRAHEHTGYNTLDYLCFVIWQVLSQNQHALQAYALRSRIVQHRYRLLHVAHARSQTDQNAKTFVLFHYRAITRQTVQAPHLDVLHRYQELVALLLRVGHNHGGLRPKR